jgi:serine/threonine-protein phosphatase 2B regulatory subunit
MRVSFAALSHHPRHPFLFFFSSSLSLSLSLSLSPAECSRQSATAAEMGGTIGKGGSRFAVTAMAHTTNFDRDEVEALSSKFADIAARDARHGTTINLDEFTEALSAVSIDETDGEILRRLFTLFDADGSGTINFQQYVSGLALLTRGSLKEKIEFSFKLFDLENTGEITKPELQKMLTAMNSTTSFFGDDGMTATDIDALVDQIFVSCNVSGEGLNYIEYCNAVAENPILVQFITKAAGGGGDDAAAAK